MMPCRLRALAPAVIEALSDMSSGFLRAAQHLMFPSLSSATGIEVTPRFLCTSPTGAQPSSVIFGLSAPSPWRRILRHSNGSLNIHVPPGQTSEPGTNTVLDLRHFQGGFTCCHFSRCRGSSHRLCDASRNKRPKISASKPGQFQRV